jgi:predicted lactoylglutathione lyase
MQLGNFSISLTVKDIGASKAFYEALGFSIFGGDESAGWLIMKNGDANIGLFQGMFDKNAITFNPGWNQSGESLATFTDIRDIQNQLKEAGISFEQEAEPGSGPASFIIVDPDGNPIIVDQHVDSAP